MPLGDASTILLDCRWLPFGGAGRTTELLLRGLAQRRPPGRWLLWGPDRLSAFAWPGSEVVPTTTDPRSLVGQRDWFGIPSCDLAVFLHQQRPLRNVPSVTLVYDTIPLRFGASPAIRVMKRAFLRRMASMSREIVTISEFSRTCIERDLGVPRRRITVARLPVDDDFADRVLALRRRLPTEPVALYVGRFAPHKNLARLVAGFEQSSFRADGGRLVMVGATEDERRQFEGSLSDRQRTFVAVRPKCGQSDLEHLFATSLLLVQPSLEEGFGLPVWEAMSCGLPVCVSDGGALPEVVNGFGEPFPATSTPAIVDALDRCATRARADGKLAGVSVAETVRRQAPKVGDFADQFLDLVGRNLR